MIFSRYGKLSRGLGGKVIIHGSEESHSGVPVGQLEEDLLDLVGGDLFIVSPSTQVVFCFEFFREQEGHTLYLFSTVEEREVFISLLMVNGLGPSVAKAILETIKVNSIINGLDKKDLIKIKGIGNVLAEKICAAIKDKKSPISKAINDIKLVTNKGKKYGVAQ